VTSHIVPALKGKFVSGGKVLQTDSSTWHLQIPPGSAGRYRLAQIDDYADMPRRDFPWQPPLRLSLRARASSDEIPGTWGFGLWNDPFGLTLVKGTQLRLPVLPNAAWFFFASPPNYLSLRDDLPAQGQLAVTFRSPPKLPAGLLLRAPLLALFTLRPLMRYLRRSARRYVQQDAISLDHDPTEWHAYEIDWRPDRVLFRLDGATILETRVSPAGPLGLVIWVDNQYASLPPDGRIGFGTLANEHAAWIELADLKLTLA
jgi:hypothetical protein